MIVNKILEIFENLTWFFWAINFTDTLFLQFLITYLIFLITLGLNVYYLVFYFFLLTAYYGLVLSMHQLDLFTGFLWLIECVLIFATLLLLFFTKPTGTKTSFNFYINKYFYSGALICAAFFYLFSMKPKTSEYFLPTNFYSIEVWDDFYEALINTNVNDFTAFLISYYVINSWEFLMFGFIILIVSVACVNLYKKIKQNKNFSIDSILQIFNFFKQSLDFIFMRQQNLNNQSTQPVGTRIFKKTTKL